MSHSTVPHTDLTGTHLTFWGLLRSEWIKLTTVRSTLWCYAILAVVIIGLAVLIGVFQLRNLGTQPGSDQTLSLALGSTTAGIQLAELVAAVLGVLLIASEYSTGMIRSTFTAAPRRIPVMLAKAVVLGVGTFVVTLVALAIALGVVEAVFSAHGFAFDAVDWHISMPVLGAAVYVALIALLAFGAGLLIRATAGSLATVLGLLLIVPAIFNVLYAVLNLNGAQTGAGLVTWPHDVSAFLPAQAGAQLYSANTAADTRGGTAATIVDSGIQLNGWGGFGVLAAWVVVVGGVATALVKRRDV